MAILLDGTGGVTTPGVVNTAGETIATTLSVTGASTFTTLSASGTVSVTQATGNNFDASGILAKNVLTLGSSGANYGFISQVSSDKWSLSYGATKTTLGTSALDWTATGVSVAGNLRVGPATTLGSIYTAAVSTTTTISSVTNDWGQMVIVSGNSGGNIFTDLLFTCTTAGPTVLSSKTISGGPVGRTYTMSAATLRLAMASGTYEVWCSQYIGK